MYANFYSNVQLLTTPVKKPQNLEMERNGSIPINDACH